MLLGPIDVGVNCINFDIISITDRQTDRTGTVYIVAI